ncbi:MAG: response regulator [Deltaproteobacteria bacterium]|nr:response regulator [Deltaproteobacteria bacterium]
MLTLRQTAATPVFFASKNHFELYPNEDNRSIFSRVVEKGEPYTAYAKPFEYAEHPERGITYWDWTLQPVKKATRGVEGLVLGLVNVIRRIKAEGALRESQKHFMTAQENEKKRVAHELHDSIGQSLEALQKIKAFLPDVIFMDIRLPGESGLELTRRIKISHPEIAIIILIAYDLREYREAAYDGGADAFIPKSSLNLADIAALIKSVFSDERCYRLSDN